MTVSISTRMKRYETVSEHFFTPNSPVVIRIDGKTFHTFLKHANRPFDQEFMDCMVHAAVLTTSDMHGFKLAYVQSDECTFVITDYDSHETQGWFGYSVPANRVVIDYGKQEDLFLLGCVEIKNGKTMEAELVSGWPGPRVPRFGHMTLHDALAIEPRQNAEGVVLTLVEREPEMRVKIKQEDYVALHRIITGLTERSVWEHLAVEACAPWITDSKHWGSFIGIDPQRAAEILAVGSEWRVVIPEEFQEWIDETAERIKTNVAECMNEAKRLLRQASELSTPREQYELVREHPCSAEIMRVIKAAGGMELVWQKAWRVSKPEAANPIFGREEDVA